MNLNSLIYKYYHETPLIKKVLSPISNIRNSLANKKVKASESVIRNLRESIVGDPVIKVDEFQGRFAIDTNSDLFFRCIVNGQYEPELVEICKKHLNRNKDVIDVGANIGFFSVLFAKLISKDNKVLAIEPTSRALERLKGNLITNEINEKVIIFNGVASNSDAPVAINTIIGKEEYSSIGAMAHPSISENKDYISEEVQSQTIDQLIKVHSLNPGFIKVDVEGAEHLVFSGMPECLNTYRPIILSELSNYLLKKNGSSSKEIIDFFEKNNYTVTDPISPNVSAGSKEFGDILCIPNELMNTLK